VARCVGFLSAPPAAPEGPREPAAPRPGERPDKGLYGGSCNRFSCQAPGATWYNHSTQRFYCKPCALLINDYKPPGDRFLESLGHPLCTEGPPA
jgi:hypothetical protein